MLHLLNPTSIRKSFMLYKLYDSDSFVGFFSYFHIILCHIGTDENQPFWLTLRNSILLTLFHELIQTSIMICFDNLATNPLIWLLWT